MKDGYKRKGHTLWSSPQSRKVWPPGSATHRWDSPHGSSKTFAPGAIAGQRRMPYYDYSNASAMTWTKEGIKNWVGSCKVPTSSALFDKRYSRPGNFMERRWGSNFPAARKALWLCLFPAARKHGCTLSPSPAPTRYSPAGSLNHAIVGPSHEKSYPGQNFHFKSWLSSNCPITM